jgi:hypothetical protein
MRATPLLCLLGVLASGGAALGAPAEVKIEASGWTITANQDQHTLAVRHEGLGVVIDGIRLHERAARGLKLIETWTARSERAGLLSVRSESPRVAWEFEARPNQLRISATSSRAVLTAESPAAGSRIVVRLIDREGVPVQWSGTGEVQEGYGGARTVNPSFLPHSNPDVMHFGLGAVSGEQFHALFDRPTDTAIEFGEGARLRPTGAAARHWQLQLDVTGNAIVRLTPEYLTNELGLPYYVPFDDSVFASAPMVWSSWTSYYEAVREQDVVQNTDWLAANLKPYGFQYVQLDDGYDRDKDGQHSWIENWNQAKFPHGAQWLTNYIHSKGLRAGIWLVPNAYAAGVQAHPDWYVHDRQGNILKDYNTPALDSTHPGALAKFQQILKTLDDWGFDYYKFDGEHAFPKYVPGADRSRLHKPGADLLAEYRERLRLMRETIGPKRFVEGCPAGTPLNGIGYFDSYFAGHDQYNNWQGMYPLFSSINANAFLNHLAVYLMPGEGLELNPRMSVDEAASRRPKVVIDIARSREDPMIGFGTTIEEARSVVTYVALTGVVYPLASVMSELPEERVELLRKTMPTLPILPMDLFSRGTDLEWDTFRHTSSDNYIHNYPEILDLKVQSEVGRYDVVALTNWRSAKTERTLDLAAKLGLDPGQRYVVFDFWQQKLLGIVRGSIEVAIEPHDTRVLLIHPLLNRPQLVGLSRHISGSYSIEHLSWKSAERMLEGTSETVAGAPYALFLHVPEGTKLASVNANIGGTRVAVRTTIAGELLSVTFDGQSAPVHWSMVFASR